MSHQYARGVDLGIHLFTVLVSYDRPFRRACICTKHNSILEETSDDGGTGAGGFGERDAALGQEVVPALGYILDSWLP